MRAGAAMAIVLLVCLVGIVPHTHGSIHKHKFAGGDETFVRHGQSEVFLTQFNNESGLVMGRFVSGKSVINKTNYIKQDTSNIGIGQCFFDLFCCYINALVPCPIADISVIAHPLRVLDKGNNSIDTGIAG